VSRRKVTIMRKALIVTILALAIMALSLSPALAQGDQAAIDEVFGETEKIRRLEAPSDIAVNFMSREELEDKLLEDMEEDMPEEETQIADEIMTMLDFIDEDLDLQEFYVDLLTEQIAGFYDPEDDSLYLISEGGDMDIMDEYTLSHELVHYLQDQNFDLERPPFEDPEDAVEETDDDAAFAATCLVEGDAVLTSDIWLVEYVDVADMMSMSLDIGDSSFEVFESAPYYIQDSLLFPYTEGNEFVDYIHSEGGFATVDAAYSNVPTSTEMIMHPEKYLEGEAVIQVDMPDVTGDLGGDWELAYDNVLGEFDVYELFKPYLSKSGLRKAAAGWGGNSYQYYRNGDGDKLLNQGYAWDSEQDAQQFAAAFVIYVEDRFEGEVEKSPDQGAWMVWTTDDYRFALKKDGINTYVVQATTQEGFDAILGSLGDEGDEIDLDAISSEEAVSSEETEEKKYYWVVVGGLVALLVIGLILIFGMLLFYRRPPSPPTQPPGGPYMYPPYPPGGGPGTGYGGQGYGGQDYGGPSAGPWGGGQAPPPPPSQPPVPPPPPPQGGQ
jgi:hypothetical protein